jgi:2-keto-4-pentenoate hydratase/2-oxohepta-3-ene-1,7-dioic acid hydratase in catechol pathway
VNGTAARAAVGNGRALEVTRKVSPTHGVASTVVRIARFAHPSGPSLPAGLAWGTVEGPPGAGPEALTVAAIDGHPFAGISFTGDRWALADVRLLSPVLPSKVVAVGRNYAAHAAKLGNDVPANPLIFMKPSTSVIGTGDFVRLPADSADVHYEGELAVVIGRPAKDVSAADALDVVLGYTCANDVTARDLQKTDGQWARAKGFDTFCPLGPAIETEFDVASATLETRLNGAVAQSAPLTDMIHSVADIIAYASAAFTLLPGDVILTGTPSGVGPFVAGDTIEVEISGLGTLRNSARDA